MRRPLVLGQRHSAPQPVRADIAPPDDLSIPVMPPLPLRPDEGPRWQPGPLDAWKRQTGLRGSEISSLVSAGLTDEDRHRWPLPDAAARTLQRLPPAQRPAEPPPPGWTSLSVQPDQGPPLHFWFQPVQSERDLRRLRHGLFLQDLAADLGMPESMPQIQPFFHRDGTRTVYGMLMRIYPGACPATDPALATDSALHRRQGNALDWLAALGNLQLPPEDLVWTLGHQGLALRPRLPVEPAPLPGGLGFGTDIRPRTPSVIGTDLALRVAGLDLGKWTDPAYPFLDPVQREQFVECVRQSWETLSQVPQLSPEAESASTSPVDARARPLSPRHLRISRKSVFGKVRDIGPASPREPQERLGPDAADRLWKHLRTPEPSGPLPDLSVRDLLALSSQPGLSHRALSAALHSGAGAHDILQAHRLQLPPSWPVLARSVLDARAAELGRLPGSPDIRTLRDQLQHAHPLPQVAHAVRKAVEAQPLSPRSHSHKETVSPPARAEAPTFTQTLERHASALFAGTALAAAIESARTFEQCRAVLLPIDIQQKTRLREACDNARAALAALSDAVVQLDKAHDRALSPLAAEIVDQISTRVEQEKHALDRLNLAVDTLGRRIPDTLRCTPTAGDLLLLQAPGGPDLDYQLHGLLAGWAAADILSAHEARWPSWAMEGGASFTDASRRHDHTAERIGKVVASLKNRPRQPH